MVSIIIVNYHVKKHLFDCIDSIISSRPKTPYEIIVVDNDEEKTIAKDLHKKLPKVIYIPNDNKGFGQGNNVGAKQAKGEYLFFLNPDTKFINNSLDLLINYLKNNHQVAIAAPLLFDKHNKPYSLQGVLELNPLRAIFSLSFISKLFPKNKIYKDYYLFDWDKKTTKEVDAVPGTAFVIRKNLFEQVGGFDEKFFLFFEEFDLCRRVRKLRYRIVINPAAKVLHYWGESTKRREDINEIFLKSRFYYFKKHFGIITATFLELILRMDKYFFLFIAILLLGIFLRTYRIAESMPFISEQGWFYLSARDMLLTGRIPLVGIASSHPWLHQGALWTYMLALDFWIFGFNPLNGAYLSVFLDILAIVFIYKLSSIMFSKRVGLMSSLLYATSPLVVLNGRMPYHTSPIPLFVILFTLFLYKWVSGNKYYFPLIFVALTALYNLELATVPFWAIFLIILLYGLWKKKIWVNEIKNLQILFLSILAFIIPMLPILIYDSFNKFPQTIGFIIWIGYRILVLFGYPPLHPDIANLSFKSFIIFAANSYQRLIIDMPLIAFTIFIFSVFIFYKKFISLIKQKIYKTNWIIMALVVTISIIGFSVIKTPSQAYLPMLFPQFIILTAIFFDEIMKGAKAQMITWAIIFLIVILNSHYLILSLSSDNKFIQRLSASREIITQAKGKEYNLKWGRVDKRQENYTQNYEYLTWWLGHSPSKKKEKFEFIIYEYDYGISVSPVIARP